jgi:hypothetical protein
MVRGSNSGRVKRFSSSPKRPHWLWGPPSLVFIGYLVYFPVVKRSGCGVDHSSPSSAEVKNEWSYTSAPPICHHSVDRHSFNFYNTEKSDSTKWNPIAVITANQLVLAGALRALWCGLEAIVLAHLISILYSIFRTKADKLYRNLDGKIAWINLNIDVTIILKRALKTTRWSLWIGFIARFEAFTTASPPILLFQQSYLTTLSVTKVI